MPTEYFAFISKNRSFVAFGFLVAFASSFGQTYFIGIFGHAFQQEFNLSHTTWGSIYLIGTLVSSLVLPITGKYIDSIELPRYALWVCLALGISCLFTAYAVVGPLTLIVAIFLLRQTGQGLSSHTAITSMARYFDKNRGRAIAITIIGVATGEALLPFIAVIMIASGGWRHAYGLCGLFVLLIAAPTVTRFLKGHSQRHARFLAERNNLLHRDKDRVPSWTRAQVLRDKRFYMILPGLLAPSYVLTAMFFHHLNLADAKGWSHVWMTGSYVIYAVVATITAIAAGQLVDKFRAVRVIPYMMIFLFSSMIAVAVLSESWTLWFYLSLAAISSGIAHTAGSALWAEIYGVDYIGAVKSLATALSVFASALGPVTLGIVLDLGFTIETGCWLFAIYIVVSTGFILAARLSESLPPPE